MRLPLQDSVCVAANKVPEYSGRAVVLNYHHVTSDGPEGIATVSATRFEAHLAFLKADGFRVVTLDRLRAFLAGEGELPAKAVCITFDDGYSSYAEVAVPMLRRYGYASTCFIVGAAASRPAPQGTLPHMTWGTMGKLVKSGLVSFGSHTHDTHGLLPGSDASQPKTALAYRLTASETKRQFSARVAADLAKSRSELRSQLRLNVDALAYPYGVRSDDLVELARAAGFRFMFTTDSGSVTMRTPHYAIPRLNAGSSWVSVEYLADMIVRNIR